MDEGNEKVGAKYTCLHVSIVAENEPILLLSFLATKAKKKI